MSDWSDCSALKKTVSRFSQSPFCAMMELVRNRDTDFSAWRVPSYIQEVTVILKLWDFLELRNRLLFLFGFIGNAFTGTEI